MKKVALLLLLCSVSQAAHIVTTAFNKGEVSPLLLGRVDYTGYYSGCQTLQNMVVLPHGAVTKRPGTYYIADANSASTACRLIPFEYSTTQTYIVEMGDEVLRFYKDGGQIVDANGAAVEVSTTYTYDELFDIQYVQSADEMYIVHASHKPAVLTRSSHTSWTLTDVNLTEGPFLDENKETTTITPSGTSGNITLTASASLFNENHVGALFEIGHPRTSNALTGTLDANESSPTIRCEGDWTLNLFGQYTGKVDLERTEDDGTSWSVAYSQTNDSAQPGYLKADVTGTEDDEDILYRLTMSNYVNYDCDYTFTVHDYLDYGVAEVNDYVSSTEVNAIVYSTLGGTGATAKWSEGAWSDDEGWPSCISFYEERQVYGGTTESPQTIWLSATDDWNDFTVGVDADDAMSVTVAADQVNVIRWFAPQTALIFGTTGGEWRLSAAAPDSPLTPEDIYARRQSTHGSALIMPVAAMNVIYFAQRAQEKIMQIAYSWEQDVWEAQDITLLSEHITGDGITQMALQRNPHRILWCVREDGALVGCSLEKSQDVIGWHIHEIGGDVESVAVIPGTAEDELWVSVKRTIDGSTVRYIEQFQPFDWGTDQEDCFFVDCGLTYDGGAAKTVSDVTKANPAVVTAVAHGFSDGDQIRIASVFGMIELNNNVYSVAAPTANTFEIRDSTDTQDIDSTGFTLYTSGGTATKVENSFTNLGHLEGETVTILGDGGYYGTETVASSAITLYDFFNTVHVGLAFTARLQTMRLENRQSPGALFGINKRLTHVTIRFYKTLACDIGPDWTSYDSFIFRDAADPLEAPPPLYSGDKGIEYDSDYETDGAVCIQSRLPTPLTVLALQREYEAYP